ncbi:uncharacterized protein LOC115758800 [Drosophila novamexicana]|uniref:uncharacterized protein LOC115758800 n=1 Tax=Drosophila novamexicana TaxID=47314 RepID=UPI0011E59FBE|nr:uncharacterized protein LOC115758800 [Drosophila novamexicana]
MAKLTRLLLLLLLLQLLTPKLVFPAAEVVVDSEPSTVSGISQFLERRPEPYQEELSWTHLLPSNYYSELNQQYYVRFRRHSRLALKDLRRARSYPFEYARYL